MTDTPPDTIRIYNAETGKMSVALPLGTPDYIVQMRNTGIFSIDDEEIFADDIVKEDRAPNLYRVVMRRGCWMALSLLLSVPSKSLNLLLRPKIVGNVYQNRDLMIAGEFDNARRDPTILNY